MNTLLETTEAEVRAMRDQIFGHPTSDGNWEACREGWLKPENIEWLRQRVAGETARRNRIPHTC